MKILFLIFLFPIGSFSQTFPLLTNFPPTTLVTNSIKTVMFPPILDITNGLVSWWPLTNTFADVIGPNSGTGTAVTFTNGPDGRSNSAAQFVAVAATHIDCGNNVSLNQFSNDMTVSWWMNTANSGNQTVISKSFSISGNSFPNPFTEILSGGKLVAERGSGTTSTFQSATEAGTYPNSTWIFMCHTTIGAVNSIYTNGVLDSAATFSGVGLPPYANSARNLQIGSVDITVSVSVYYNGKLAGIRLYSRGLSAAEVRQIYLIGINRKVF